MSYPIRLALAVVAAVASVAGGTADGAEPVSTDTQVVTAAVSQDVINAEAVERPEIDFAALNGFRVDDVLGDGRGNDLCIRRDGLRAVSRSPRHRRHSGDDGESQSDRVAHLHVLMIP